MSTPTIDALTAVVRNADLPDLTLRQIAVLGRIVATKDHDRTIRGLAAHLALSKPAVTRAADRLATFGYSKRVPDASDRRSVFVVPTKSGEKFLAKYFL